MMVYGGICRHGKMSDMPNSSARLNKIEVFESRGFQDGLNLAKRSFDTHEGRISPVTEQAMWLR